MAGWKRPILRVTLALAFLAVAGCAALLFAPNENERQAQVAYQQALGRWRSRSFSNYRMVLEDGACQVDYEVRHEQVGWGYEVTCGRGSARTITNLFDMARPDAAFPPICPGMCVCQPEYRLAVAYDSELGYPTRIEAVISWRPDWQKPAFWAALFPHFANPCPPRTRRVLRVVELVPHD